MASATLWLCSAHALLVALTAAAGCDKPLPADIKVGELQQLKIYVEDPAANRNRKYLLNLPKGYTGNSNLPLLLYFHGTGDNAIFDDGTTFNVQSDVHNFIYVKPIGMKDDKQSLRSWNVGHAGRTDVCKESKTTPNEYDSCKKLKMKGPCNCYTCFDDVEFVNKLVEDLLDKYCVEPSQIFTAGASNGGIFSHYLAAQLVHRKKGWRLAGIASWYGGVFRNMLDVPAELQGMSILYSGGLKDTTVPPSGGRSYDGYLYINMDKVLNAYAKLDNASVTVARVQTPYDGLDKKFYGCSALLRHPGSSFLWNCSYDRGHGFWNKWTEAMIWWFFASASSKNYLNYNLSVVNQEQQPQVLYDEFPDVREGVLESNPEGVLESNPSWILSVLFLSFAFTGCIIVRRFQMSPHEFSSADHGCTGEFLADDTIVEESSCPVTTSVAQKKTGEIDRHCVLHAIPKGQRGVLYIVARPSRCSGQLYI